MTFFGKFNLSYITLCIKSDVSNQIINGKTNKNFCSAGFSDLPAITATVFSKHSKKVEYHLLDQDHRGNFSIAQMNTSIY